MHQQQKLARFTLAVIAGTMFLFVSIYAVIYLSLGPKAAYAAFGAFGLFGILGFSPLFLRKRKGSSAVVMDERDLDIQRGAHLVAWSVVWLFWGLLCMGPWIAVIVRSGVGEVDEVGIPVSILPMAYIAAGIVHAVAWSITVLVAYGKELEDHEG